MSLSSRLATLAAAAVAASGLAHAGWLAWSWPTDSAWVPLAAQLAWTLTLAAALAWQIGRSLRPLQQSLVLLRGQAEALEHGRFVVVEPPPLAEVMPLARSLNTTVRRLQAALEHAPGDSAQVLRRAARCDTRSGLDSRYTFLRRLGEQLAERAGAEASLLVLRLLPPPATALGGPLPSPPAAADAEQVAVLAALLRAYPQRIPGAFVGRLGERDFGLCLPAHDVSGETAASLMAAVGAERTSARCVIGAVDHLGGTSLGAALTLVDLALAQAECGGAGQIEHRSARHESVAPSDDSDQRRRIIDALRHGELELAAFPVLDAQGRLLHLECPMRLRLQAGGALLPAHEWLPVATRYRLVTQIDLAGLELALVAAARDGVPRSVHVAAESLTTAGFVSAVRTRLEAAPAAAALLCIEIAEVSLERLPLRLRNAGTVWRRCGVRVGIEHAGAVLRSLVRLSQLEFDYVKVDADFVRGLAHDAAQRERAQGLVAFVHELGAQVIAEGVADEADLAALWQIGFDAGTGAAVSAQAARAAQMPEAAARDAGRTEGQGCAPAVARAQAMSPT